MWVARLVLLLLAVVWTAVLVGNWRTAQFGQSSRMLWASLLFICIFDLPVAALTLLGLRWRHYFIGLLVVLVVPFVLPEILARAQEASFKSRFSDLPADAEAVYEARWWPFRGNVILYDPKTREWYGDC